MCFELLAHNVFLLLPCITFGDLGLRPCKASLSLLCLGDGKNGDVEKGGSSGGADGPSSNEIIPIYRRDCHEEVYCGSHMYPGRGVYLLKFDNSYSLWRSKTLYYRVYYTR